MDKTLKRPVNLYGHEAWLEEDLQALGVFERRVLRTIFGEPSIQKVVKAEGIRWAELVARLPNNNPAKLVFATDPVGTR